MNNNPNHAESIRKLGELIKDVKIAMLTTVDQNGTLQSRPMGTLDSEFDGTLWFFTASDSPKVGDIRHEEQVNVAYSDPKNQTYVSMSGMAHLVPDRTKMEQFWNPVLKAWFPDGLDTPNLTLLHIHVHQAQYWDSPNGRLVTAIGMVKAMVTGEPADDLGENEKVNLGA